jgi:hypothetical protein
MEKPLRRSFFRFSIRDFLWATAFLAACIGWWQDRREHTRLAIEVDALRLERSSMAASLQYHEEAYQALLREVRKTKGGFVALSRGEDGRLSVVSFTK